LTYHGLSGHHNSKKKHQNIISKGRYIDQVLHMYNQFPNLRSSGNHQSQYWISSFLEPFRLILLLWYFWYDDLLWKETHIGHNYLEQGKCHYIHSNFHLLENPLSPHHFQTLGDTLDWLVLRVEIIFYLKICLTLDVIWIWKWSGQC
jgi:hypothetical protein